MIHSKKSVASNQINLLVCLYFVEQSLSVNALMRMMIGLLGGHHADQYKHLLSPIDVGPFTLRNRVLVTAHVPGIETNGQVNEAYIRYQIAKTKEEQHCKLVALLPYIVLERLVQAVDLMPATMGVLKVING